MATCSASMDMAANPSLPALSEPGFLLRLALAAGVAVTASPAFAQQMPMDMPGMAAGQSASAPHDDIAHAAPEQGGAMADMPGMSGMTMPAMLGRYPMTRESSGTAWQPDSAAMRGMMFAAGDWSLMAEGFVTGIYDRQGGPRGRTKTFSNSMAMLMASRDISAADRIGLRAMLSLDPTMGRSGYPLLFATGETADGRTQLVDRQHPHDLFMELAATLSHDLGTGRAVSLYAGLPGEPALGPPTFMHRVSGMDNPEAPIGHHWFDSTHITFGVITAGVSTGHWKIEASAFKGREPDQHRWDIETPRLDSWAVRGFWNPAADLSFQLSTGHLHSPEQLEPDRDERRTTASLTWNKPLGRDRSWATTIAWSDKDGRPGPALTGLLAETALRIGRHEIYARAEREQENELFEDGPLAGRIFDVAKLSLGYQHELPLTAHVFLAVGGLASAYSYPDRLKPEYGGEGVKSFMLYGRLRFSS